MGIESMGNIIAKLRKEMGVTQEELAKHALVSTQAVSKWENGGVPDTELLPKIADFFKVSVDTLFGRNITDYSDIENALGKKIAETQPGDRFDTAFQLCWVIERAFFGGDHFMGDTIEKYQKAIENGQQCSSVRTDEGFTLMGLSKRLPYFLLVPEIEDTNLAFFEGIDYVQFFKDFSDKAVFDAMVFLNKRNRTKAFTPNLLVKNLNIEPEKAADVIKILRKYKVIQTTQIEMDDTAQEVYSFIPTPSFTAMLIFAREMIDHPNSYAFFNEARNKPYLT